MKRYEVDVDSSNCFQGMNEDIDGEWVSYEDHIREVKIQKGKCEVLQKNYNDVLKELTKVKKALGNSHLVSKQDIEQIRSKV
jgi:hypothetical protein